uniref:Uncharacterized protein n=1 Tax=Eptatretus burgeri TaxID=7764 RepID=A0A8C4QEN8_EPTBU
MAYIAIGTGLCELLALLMSTLLIERLGRKPLLIGGYSMIALSCVIITISLSLQEHVYWMPFLSASCVFACILSFGIGPDHDVIHEHHSPWRLMSDLVRQPAYHHCKQERAQSRYLMQSHLDLKPVCHSDCTPHRCHTVLIHILHHPHILLYHSRLPHTIPQLLSWHPVISFL